MYTHPKCNNYLHSCSILNDCKKSSQQKYGFIANN